MCILLTYDMLTPCWQQLHPVSSSLQDSLSLSVTYTPLQAVPLDLNASQGMCIRINATRVSASMPLGLQDIEVVSKMLVLTPQTDKVVRAPVWIGSILTSKALDESGQLCGVRRVRALAEFCLLQEQYSNW